MKKTDTPSKKNILMKMGCSFRCDVIDFQAWRYICSSKSFLFIIIKVNKDSSSKMTPKKHHKNSTYHLPTSVLRPYDSDLHTKMLLFFSPIFLIESVFTRLA